MVTAPEDANPFVVEATADKALFVSMLVKDIELLPAVIDLVDNSVDGSRAATPNDLSRHYVKIEARPDSFTIEDNAGGIDVDVARHYAFRFGRPRDYTGVPGSVGQFGVGMKRALFKLGRHFVVSSRTSTTAFELPVDVDEWLDDLGPNWQFKMSHVDESYDPTSNGGVGTKIVVTRLHESVAEDFDNPLILGQMREQMRLRHQEVIQAGLSMELNGEALTGYEPTLMSGPRFAPVNRRFVVTAGGGQVNCHLLAGVTLGEKDDHLDEGEAQDFRSAGDAGWWLFCNDRLLLFRERSTLTGWGDGAPAYHPQYRRFRGYVYLTSLDTSLLPWNTTKTGVDQDSRVWRQVQSEMKVALGQVTTVINRMKEERQHGETPEDMPLTLALKEARPTAIDALKPAPAFVAPQPRRQPRKVRATTQKIQYSVDRDRYQEVAELLEASAPAEVGRSTFDYFYEREAEF